MAVGGVSGAKKRLGQMGDGRLLKKDGERDALPEVGLDLAHQPNGEQRVASEIKKSHGARR